MPTQQCYLIKCPCALAYVGKTATPITIRISKRQSNIYNQEVILIKARLVCLLSDIMGLKWSKHNIGAVM